MFRLPVAAIFAASLLITPAHAITAASVLNPSFEYLNGTFVDNGIQYMQLPANSTAISQ